jgi:integrase
VRGTIIKYKPKRGKPTFGYSFFVGRGENGKRIQKLKRGFVTKAEADEACQRAIAEHQKAPAPERTMPTFAEFFERWHREVVMRAHSPKTAERSHELGQYAVRLFGDTPLDQLTSEQLTAAVNRLLDHGGRVTKQYPHGKPLAPKTVRHIAFLVQACLQQAMDWDIIPKNPMKKVRKPKVPRRRPHVVDRAGFDALLGRAAGLGVYPVIVVAMATGMRRGELLALEWSDVDWDSGLLEVSKSLEETKSGGLRIKTTKSGHARRFAIPASVLEVLRQHRQDQDHQRALYGSDYGNLNLVFARPDGHYYNPDKLGVRIRRVMQSAGLTGVSLHSLRHSHASELLSKGAPITAVAERLGHASPNITLGIYSHALPMDNQATAQLWNNAMSEVVESSRKEVLKNRMSSNVITTDREKIVIPIKSAS